MCCSMMQLSVNFIRTSASAIGRSLRGHGCGNCCPGSGFFGPQSSGAIVAAVQSFAVWCGTTACVHVPIHSRNTANCWGSAASTTPLAMRFTSFAGGGENFTAACLIVAQCKAARMLQESVRLQCCTLLQGVSAISAHQPHVPTCRARTSARVRSTRPSLPMRRASLQALRSPFGAARASAHRRLHACRHREPAPAAWDPARPTWLQRVQP